MIPSRGYAILGAALSNCGALETFQASHVTISNHTGAAIVHGNDRPLIPIIELSNFCSYNLLGPLEGATGTSVL
jgi:hypothetical protein